MSNNVVVLGSINVDTTYHVDRFPQPGETISAVSKSSALVVRVPIKQLQQPALVPKRPLLGQLVLIKKELTCLNHWLMTILIHATS